jgi:hypothetical protein
MKGELGKRNMQRARDREVKDKTTHVTSRGSLYGGETSRIPHCLDNRLTDGGEVISLRSRLLFTLRNIPGTHILEAESNPGP